MTTDRMNRTVRDDVRDILGMRTRAAWGLSGLFAVSITSMALAADEGIRDLRLTALAAVLILGAGSAILLAPGDPLPTPFAVPVAAAAPLSAALAIWQLPVPMANSTQIWFLGAASAYLNFLCVRGAPLWAWAGVLGQIVVCAWWTTRTGQGWLTGVGFSFINLTPLLMATFFGRVVRPLAHSILALRQQDTERAAAEAAAQAAQQERDERVARLDSAARPLLEIIASGRPLTAQEQAECRLVEAELRDDILGGVMIDASVGAAARCARQRGVTVVLDDGGGLDEVDAELRQQVRTVLRDALDYADGGTVTARVLPPGRSTLASILLRDNGELRIEVESTGAVRSDLDDRQLVRDAKQDPRPAG
ncbi:hypothetical protein DFR70_101147 [Nocardia tenerifensis]|uniref:Signal transduction histidine kinase n=1 Tax=Nocardia tenerifensis TaxID=228006 RepID=A0A318K9G9_9NOCA|nr:hypothetical protein [Nocardia tenerifensis]PXX70726.1 hypothetical protein DFR70_101147 [Nocardia tenerifensis]